MLLLYKQTLKQAVAACATVVFGALVVPNAIAQSNIASAGASASAEAQIVLAEGEVRKVDLDARKVTLKHGEIKNLDMPPMTMTFNVKEATLLDKLQVGDRIRFRAEKQNGSYWLTVIERSK